MVDPGPDQMVEVSDSKSKSLVHQSSQSHLRPDLREHSPAFVDHEGPPTLSNACPDIPESPLTKRLGLEAKEKPVQETEKDELPTINFLKRPESHGNDINAFSLFPGPMCRKPKPTHISFAPKHRHSNSNPSHPVAGTLPQSNTPFPSLRDGTTPSTPTNRRDNSLPGRQQEALAAVANNESITITSDKDESVLEIDDNPVEAGHLINGSRHTSVPDEINLTILSRQPTPERTSLSPQVIEISADSTPRQTSKSQLIQDILVVEQDDGSNSTAGSVVDQRRSATPNTPNQRRSRRSTSILLVPAGHTGPRVTKQSAQGPGRSTDPVQLVPASGIPSEEDLLFVLIARCRERGEAADRSKAKVKTLEHRFFELQRDVKTLHNERDAALAAHNELNQNYYMMQAKLDDFRSKYAKLKEFARSIHREFLVLQQGSQKHTESIQDLRQNGHDIRTSLSDIGSGLQSAQRSIGKQGKEFRSIRSETTLVFSALQEVTQDLNAKSTRLREEVQKNKRLENHIIDLENTQRRYNQATKESNQDIGSALARMSSKLDGIEFAALLPPLASATMDERFALITELLKKMEVVTPVDFQKLSSIVANLNSTVSQGVSKIDRAFERIISENQPVDFTKPLEDLNARAESLRPSIEDKRRGDVDRARLEERLTASMSMIEQLQNSTKQAESHAVAFQKGIENNVNISKAQQRRFTELEDQSDKFQLRWKRATSNLANLKQDLAGKQQEVGWLHALLADEEHERQIAEQNAVVLRQEGERTLKVTMEYQSQLEKKTIALKNAQAELLREEEVSAMAAAELETLRLSYSILQSTNDRAKSDAHTRLREHARIQDQLKTTLQEVEKAKKESEELQGFQSLYQTAKEEVEMLKDCQTQLWTLQEQFDALQKEMTAKTSEISTLRIQITEAEKYPVMIRGLDRKIEKANAEQKELQDKLKAANSEVSEVHELRMIIRSKNAAIEQLEGEVNAARQSSQQLQVARQENELLIRSLTDTRNDLEAVQQLAQSLSTQNEELQHKDSQIASLQIELDRLNAESQESARAADPCSQYPELDAFPSQQSNLSIFQSNPNVDALGSHHSAPHELPQRKVTDRSVLQKVAANSLRRSQGDLNNSQPQSSFSTDVVPNSQLDVNRREALEVIGPVHDNEGDSSSLSPAHSDVDGTFTDDDAKDDEPEIPETLQEGVVPLSRLEQPHVLLETLPDRDRSSVRPSSSAMSEDLFKQHATNLGTTAQNPRHLKRTGRDSRSSLNISGHKRLGHISQGTISPKDLHLHPDGFIPPKNISPKHLRSGTQFGEQTSTPGPDTKAGVTEEGQITPNSNKDRHQPNSAAKRSAEDSASGAKRLKRNPDNLMIQPPKSMNLLSSQPNPHPSPATNSRRKGSVVGTSAPVPGKVQKTAKAARNNSKPNKYSVKFSQKS